MTRPEVSAIAAQLATAARGYKNPRVSVGLLRAVGEAVRDPEARATAVLDVVVAPCPPGCDCGSPVSRADIVEAASFLVDLLARFANVPGAPPFSLSVIDQEGQDPLIRLTRLAFLEPKGPEGASK